ncbi:class I SAM-dependent methyltransferase [Bergeyella sp. RCAD1439]|uniref:class I SAM-dependent methyltransferase n=1 Tax=Bergeyella anatis TaxID=3113737 RepID=UPI002E19592A|nr:class I SAM-dependent methyltransferase [Bergeyella sp. RCAD1439]
MNLEHLLSDEVQSFIDKNADVPVERFLLTKSPFPEVPISVMAGQIKGRKVAAKKFPFLLREGVVFPPSLNLEQASSLATARYKAKGLSGETFTDLTCGFGIDAFFLSRHFKAVDLVERNAELLSIVRHNWGVLGRGANFVSGDLLAYLEGLGQKRDLIYLDPARRDRLANKVFLLEDLSPNLLEIESLLLAKGRRIMIKLSPLIDLAYLVNTLKSIGKIEVVAVKNEVKELLVHLYPEEAVERVQCVGVNLETEEPDFSFFFGEEVLGRFGALEEYLYLPNNAVLKLGAFHLVAERFGLKKLHPNTHLYTSSVRREDFPGRVFRAQSIDAKHLKKGERYNIISKNHPLKPEAIKKKYKLKDGGSRYLIFTRGMEGTLILEADPLP